MMFGFVGSRSNEPMNIVPSVLVSGVHTGLVSVMSGVFQMPPPIAPM